MHLCVFSAADIKVKEQSIENLMRFAISQMTFEWCYYWGTKCAEYGGTVWEMMEDR